MLQIVNDMIAEMKGISTLGTQLFIPFIRFSVSVIHLYIYIHICQKNKDKDIHRIAG